MKFILAILILQLGSLFSQENDWRLVSDQDSLIIYTRRSDMSSIKEVKIEAQLNCKMSEVIAALEDIPTQKDWLMRTKEARFVKQNSPGNFSYYLSTDMPFPVKDRDIVVNYNRTYDKARNEVTIEYEELNGEIPVNKAHVRIPDMKAYYKLTSVQQDQVSIEYYLYLDAGGALPNWVVNLAITKGPEATMNSLFDIVHSGKYRSSQVMGMDH